MKLKYRVRLKWCGLEGLLWSVQRGAEGHRWQTLIGYGLRDRRYAIDDLAYLEGAYPECETFPKTNRNLAPNDLTTLERSMKALDRYYPNWREERPDLVMQCIPWRKEHD